MDVVVNSDCSLPPAIHPIKSQLNVYLNLLKCFGYESTQPPMGDLLRSFYGLQGQWLVVTPILWQATHNDAMLMACSAIPHWSDVRARALFEVFSTFVAEEGMQTHYHDAYTWLLQCDEKPSIMSPPPHALLHQSIFSYLNSLDRTLFWQRFLTEIQMLFQSTGENLPVNGIWVWGFGRLGALKHRQILVESQQQYHLASLLSDNIHYLDVTAHADSSRNVGADFRSEQIHLNKASLDKHALLLFDSLNGDRLGHLEAQLKGYHVNWYWNNLAYKTPKSSWLSKIFS